MGEANRIGLRLVPEGAGSAGVLTFTGIPSAAEIVTIGSTVYTFVAAPAAAYDVDIGVDAAGSLLNLVKAINLTGIAGTDYGTGTLEHPDVIANEGAGDTIDVVAKILGVVGDTIASTTDVTGGSWGAGTLAGGVDKGTTPTDSPDWLQMCYTSEDLSAGQNFDRSERICSGTGGAARMMRKRALASAAPGGSVSFELMYGPFLHEIFRAALQGQYITDVPAAGQFQSKVGISQQAYSIEKYYDEISGTFEVWTGEKVDQLALSMPHGSKATGQITFAGNSHDATLTTSRVGSGTVTGEPANEVLSAARDFANIQIDNAAIPGIVINQVDITFANGLRPVNGLGSIGPVDHRSGDASITGTIQMYLSAATFDEYKDAIANVNKKLEFELVDPAGNVYHFELPVVNFTSDPPSSPGRNQDVFWRAPFEAHTSEVLIWRDDA